jgi:Zn2+/Cd2+-exporting ATPase
MIKIFNVELKKKLAFDLFAVITSLILMVIATFSPIDNAPFFWGFAFFIGGIAKAIEGFKSTIAEKSLNVEFLMIAASLAAFITGEFAEGAILIFIFAVSGVLEEFANSQSEKALTSLLKVAPRTAIKLINGVEKTVEISQLEVGDLVMVKMGQQVPADGVVFKGSASFNQASITGEFLPVFKHKGDSVFAGAINIDASLVIQVTTDPSESIVQKMIAFVKQAQEDKTKSELTISLFEKIYVYFVILLSISVIFLPPYFGWLGQEESFRRGIIVLVVASPCALVASITPAVLSTLSHAAKKGILIKGGKHLEKLKGIDIVTFDKTGTITSGKPKVTQLVSFIEDETSLLEALVSVEKKSTHPLAKAIVEHYKTVKSYEVETKETPGQGLVATIDHNIWKVGRFAFTSDSNIEKKLEKIKKQGQTIVYVIKNDLLVAVVTLMDTIRPNILEAISSLKKYGIQSVMLTGDNAASANLIASEVGIDKFYSECMPEDKVKVIQDYRRQGHQVLMIGDGINDAPSLVSANIGVSMGDGTDVSLETADIVMMNNDLRNIPYLMKITKKMNTIVLQNVVFSISVITLLLMTNLFGFVDLTYGVFGHEVSTILVILNSLRLLKSK